MEDNGIMSNFGKQCIRAGPCRKRQIPTGNIKSWAGELRGGNAPGEAMMQLLVSAGYKRLICREDIP